MNDTTPTPPQYGGPAAFPAPRPRRRRRGRLVAIVLAASLVAGGAAGVGGTLTWHQLSGDEPAEPSAGRTAEGSPSVSDDAEQVQVTEPQSVAAVADQVLPSVVKIDVRTPRGSGSGSGVILSEDGKILTNYHVVAPAAQGGGELTVSFDEGTSAPARVLGTDPLTDTAVIQARDVSGVQPASIGDSADLRVGQSVVAVGSPYGLDATVTTGIVSALNRAIDVGSTEEGAAVYPAIQTDAAINPGNSGGPLVDMNGNVVGITSSIRTGGGPRGGQGGSIGLGFAIPIDEIMPLVEQMAAGEEPTHARLGITVSDTEPGTTPRAGIGGALVREVAEETAASESGLQSGDVITQVDDTTITDANTLIATIRSYRPGDEVTLTYVRDGEAQETTVALGSD